MKNLIRHAAVAACTLAVGCSSMSFNNDWDRDASFANYHTYAWLEQPASPTATSAKVAQAQNPLITKRIHDAVDQQMVQKGFSLKTEGADILLVTHRGSQDKLNVTDWGYRYSYDYYGWGGRNIDVYQYTEGTLIVDMIDGNTKELVWRGSATGTIDPDASSEKIDALINKAVAGIFENYPPRQR